MKCRQCGTEIADKAIVCYRCGTATTDPVRRPAEIRPRRGGLLSIIALIVLLALGLYLGMAGRSMGPGPDATRLETVAGILIAAALVTLVIRIVRRRRR
jgi:4-amino-4-deoxy-L-arabinose transferase-like glycosyltransferase